MRSTIRAAAALAAAAILALPAAAQTYSECNPLTQDCQPVSALGKTVTIDFSSASDSFVTTGDPTYGPDGASFTVAKSGDNPNIASRWYIMFGQVDVELKAAPGVGMVSSFFMQSDCLDEIDWEWLGADNAQVQSNYFGKGQTTTYNRGAFHANPGNQDGFQKYTIIWTAEQIVWQINGVTVRTLAPADSNNQYPQTPMQIKIGAWAGGDASNAPGTIEWAGGPIDYSNGPFSMHVKSLKVQDYSTGTQYSYGDKSGTWQSIKSTGGQINSGGSPVEEPAPAVTSSVNGQPIPFTPSDKSSVYPFVPNPTTMSTATTTYGNYPGLPSGWTVSDTGKVVPPSSAPATSPVASSTPSSQASPSEPSSVAETSPTTEASPTSEASPTATTLGLSTTLQVITTYDDKGFTTVYTAPADATAKPKSFDSQGFPITAAPSPTPRPSADLQENNMATSSTIPPVPTATSSAFRPFLHAGLALLAASFGVLSVIL